MRAYKLLRVRKDGTLGSLFINRAGVVPIGIWLDASYYPTKNYKPRAGWHATISPIAPHLTMKGRRWYEVEITGVQAYLRPTSQGSVWYTAKRMKVLKEV